MKFIRNLLVWTALVAGVIAAGARLQLGLLPIIRHHEQQ